MTDISEFETIFRCHYRPLTMYALRYTENIDDAEDIVQQSFIDIWERLSGGMAIDNLKAYLYTVVRNGSLTCVIHSPQKSTIQENEMEDISEEERIIVQNGMHNYGQPLTDCLKLENVFSCYQNVTDSLIKK